jgi:hypothetical protein
LESGSCRFAILPYSLISFSGGFRGFTLQGQEINLSIVVTLPLRGILRIVRISLS